MMKYIKLFEAFKSETLNAFTKFVKENKSSFLRILNLICDRLNFPKSELSEDLFEYLTFNDALKIKPSPETKPEEIEWFKFWFDEKGNFIEVTVTDGTIRKKTGSGKISTSLDDYEIVEVLKYTWGDEKSVINKLKNYPNCTFVYFKPRVSLEATVGITYIEKDRIYILQDEYNGAVPSFRGYEYEISEITGLYPKLSWVISSCSDHGETDVKILKLIEKDKTQNPYSWNVGFDEIDFKPGSIHIEEKLENASFSLVLNYKKLKQKAEENKDRNITSIRKAREESRESASAFKIPSDISEANFDRYISTICSNVSKKLQLTEGSDMSILKTFFTRIFGYNYTGYYILQGLNFETMESVLINIYELISIAENVDDYGEEDYKDEIENTIKNISDMLYKSFKGNKVYNSNIANNIEQMVIKSDSEEHTKLVYKLIEVNELICSKIKNEKIESIEDLEVLFRKIKSISEAIKNSPRYKYCRYAWDTIYWIESENHHKPLNGLNNIRKSQIPRVLENFDKFIKFIEKI